MRRKSATAPSPTLGERSKGRLDVAVAAGFDNDELLCNRMRRSLHISSLRPDVILMRLGKDAPLGRDIERCHDDYHANLVRAAPLLPADMISGRTDLADGPVCS